MAPVVDSRQAQSGRKKAAMRQDISVICSDRAPPAMLRRSRDRRGR